MKSLERLESKENEEHSGKVQFIRERYEGKSDFDFDFDFEKGSQVESWNPKLWFMNRGIGKIKSEFDLKGSWLTIGTGPAGREREWRLKRRVKRVRVLERPKTKEERERERERERESECWTLRNEFWKLWREREREWRELVPILGF